MHPSDLDTLTLDEFYSELDWPAIPDELCEEILDMVANANPVNIREFDDPHKSSGFAMHAIPASVLAWRDQHLSIIPADYIIRIQRIPQEGVLAHRDDLRTTAFNFVLTDDMATTSWHDERYNEIAKVVYKPRTWYKHQSQVLHSVHSGHKTRLAVTIFKFQLCERDWNSDFTGDRTDIDEVYRFYNL